MFKDNNEVIQWVVQQRDNGDLKHKDKLQEAVKSLMLIGCPIIEIAKLTGLPYSTAHSVWRDVIDVEKGIANSK
jgi:hypothetical protein